MEEILEVLNQTSGIQGCLIVGKDGLVIAESGDIHQLDVDLLGATSSEFYASAESMIGEKFDYGLVDLVHVDSEKGKFLMMGINEVSFLLVMARSKVNLGLVRWEVRAAAEKLKDVL